MKQLTRDWLNSAQDDLATIAHLIDDPVLTNVVAFHSQQAIEKTFKAIFEEMGIDLMKTHNLQSLFLKIESIVPFKINELTISELDRLYIDTRYPTDLGLMPYRKPGLDEAEIYYREALRIKEQTEIYVLNPGI